MADPWTKLNQRIIACRRCRRLRDYCRAVARQKRAAYADWDYWGRPVPDFGDPAARLLIVGLAPSAHGANRTGRMFTGDRSGEYLYAALHEAGFASQAEAEHAEDGLTLLDCVITAPVHCAPPDNRPTRAEFDNCQPWLEQTFDVLDRLRLVVALGKVGHDCVLRLYKRRGAVRALADHRFAHGRLHAFGDAAAAPPMLDTYHPSQQNTFTGRLTLAMLVDIFERARELIDPTPGRAANRRA